ncbi:hypothetical protein [Embleya sp. MST-111070]|uniref:hypothetical protein n=1 Tax=Embleya sp. MST-111070 TaxID=3398231 RepID=UPI003F73DF1A
MTDNATATAVRAIARLMACHRASVALTWVRELPDPPVKPKEPIYLDGALAGRGDWVDSAPGGKPVFSLDLRRVAGFPGKVANFYYRSDAFETRYSMHLVDKVKAADRTPPFELITGELHAQAIPPDYLPGANRGEVEEIAAWRAGFSQETSATWVRELPDPPVKPKEPIYLDGALAGRGDWVDSAPGGKPVFSLDLRRVAGFPGKVANFYYRSDASETRYSMHLVDKVKAADRTPPFELITGELHAQAIPPDYLPGANRGEVEEIAAWRAGFSQETSATWVRELPDPPVKPKEPIYLDGALAGRGDWVDSAPGGKPVFSLDLRRVAGFPGKVANFYYRSDASETRYWMHLVTEVKAVDRTPRFELITGELQAQDTPFGYLPGANRGEVAVIAAWLAGRRPTVQASWISQSPTPPIIKGKAFDIDGALAGSVAWAPDTATVSGKPVFRILLPLEDFAGQSLELFYRSDQLSTRYHARLVRNPPADAPAFALRADSVLIPVHP